MNHGITKKTGKRFKAHRFPILYNLCLLNYWAITAAKPPLRAILM